ncbi:suppressor of RPS4-RLD 1 [Nicotiana sylvestris]|uniref:Tetratricopeptide repeat protein 13 n=1 Tax=Nicotiana sylvestris TaxID=4096 RepID=A0A1U7VJN0_NICSY|nr:PREDICTED: tetratricopeptide repeat protein 13 [Nicotiana sylvestris]
MTSKVTERIELAKLCSSKEWSKAIRILDSLLAQSCVIQDICNRAFCYSQLELHKHVIKDCDKALQLDPKLLQAYILKGRAFSALGKKEEALLIWEQGHEHAVHQSADLKQLLELEELLKNAKQNITAATNNHSVESSGPESNTGPLLCTKSAETCDIGKASDRKLKECSSGMLVSCEKSNDSSVLQNSSSNNAKKHKKSDRQPNGLHERQANGTKNNCKKLGYPSLVCSELSDISEDSRKSSAVTSESSEQSEPNELQEILCQLNNKCDVRLELTEKGKRNKKFCVTRINKTKSINVDFRLSRGIAQVNDGRYGNAVSIFDQILEEDPTYPEALIGRGTALAFQRELDAAIADFTKAIQSNPSAGEAWKRRGQARAALGESAEAIADLTKALEFEPDSADILHERGIVNFKFKDFKAAVEDLSRCVKFDKDNKSAYTYLGLALSSLGEYRRAEEAHKKAIQIERNFLEAWAHLAQLYQDLANSEKALECLHQLLQIDGRYAKGYHLRGLLLHGMGEHRNAIKDLSMGLAIDSANVECLYLRASCYHAIGEYKEAVKDYDAALDLELDSMEKFVLQCLAFYQKEIALYSASKITSEFCWFDIDGDIDPLFKEYWCKRLHPKNVCEKVYRQPPLKESLKKGKRRKQEFTFTKQKTALLQAADSVGSKIQYHCPGFLHNRRQHRMAGLAAIEIAQKVSKAWRALQAEWRNSTKGTAKSGKRLRRREKVNSLSVNRGGAGCSTSSSSETSTSYSLIDDRSTGRSTMSWNQLYSLAVKWRQISEPCDPVVWINKLSEEFNSGFGSNTPLVLGQAKVVRYYPNFQRTLTVAKAVIKEKKSVFNKEDKIIDLSEERKLQEIMTAESSSDLHRVVGQDFWLATWCNSTALEGKHLEGTRITLMKMGEIGYDFAIRTPCTPSRWDDFDMEMTSAWEALCDAYCGENYGSTDFDVLENVRDAILRMTYYWYNFMPLSRGTAVVGFIVLLGLLLAANMEFTGSIPKGLQVDWEAILEFDPSSFVDSVKRWLYPSLKVSTSWKTYPDVTSTFETTGSVVAALSSYSD